LFRGNYACQLPKLVVSNFIKREFEQ
jgi:hypothetical protein